MSSMEAILHKLRNKLERQKQTVIETEEHIAMLEKQLPKK